MHSVVLSSVHLRLFRELRLARLEKRSAISCLTVSWCKWIGELAAKCLI